MANYNMTPKQIRFAELVALEGYKLVNAWLEAYDSDPLTPRSTSRPAASKLASQPRVAAYISQLRDEAREELVRQNTWGKFDVIARATRHMEAAATNKQFSAANGALAQIIDLEGLAATRKVEINGSLDVNHYASLSMEQLLALADRADSLDALPPADDTSIVNVQGRLVED